MTEVLSGIHSIPYEQYRKASGVACSDLDWIERSPLHFRAHMDGQIPEEETEAQTIGTITHRAILERDTMDGSFFVKPEGMNFSTNAGKAWRDEHAGKPIISTEVAKNISAMTKAVHAHPMAARIMASADFERSLFADDDGLLLKGRFDILPTAGNAVADLKTCERADLESVEKAIGNFKYFKKAAFYLRIADLLKLDRNTFIFIFVEKSPPYAVACYQLADEVLRAGNILIERDLMLLRNCMAEDKWPGYGDGVRAAAVPNYLLKQFEQL